MPPRKPLAALVLALAAVACVPGPKDQVDWVGLPDAVIVQLDYAPGHPPPGGAPRPDLPAFTLYGDGALLLAQETGEATTVVRARLSATEMEDLLGFIEGTGFFNFSYEQPDAPVNSQGTTYLYVNTRDATNAVRAYALGVELPGEREYRQLERLVDIRDRLDEVAAAAATTPFAPSAGALEVDLLGDGPGTPWPYPRIDLAALAPEPGRVTHVLSVAELAALDLADPPTTTCWCPVQSGGLLYNVLYRPVLPFEERFPEFEP